MKNKIASLMLASLMFSIADINAVCYSDGDYVCHSATSGKTLCIPPTNWSTSTGYINRAAGGASSGYDDKGYYDTHCSYTLNSTDCYGLTHSETITDPDPIQGSYAQGNPCGGS